MNFLQAKQIAQTRADRDGIKWGVWVGNLNPLAPEYYLESEHSNGWGLKKMAFVAEPEMRQFYLTREEIEYINGILDYHGEPAIDKRASV